MALGRSCLLANTRTTASRNSSSANMRCNSSLAELSLPEESSILSRSLLSTTKMIPCVFW